MSIDYISLMPSGFIQDPARGAVYPAQPDQVDDLTQIHGIGEVLESQLNINGVYRLEQIASWEQKNVEAFSNMMPCFQDRIERNYWILQAQRIVERRRSTRPVSAAVSSGFPAGLIQTVMMLAVALLLGLLFVQWLAGGKPRTYAGNLRARTFHAVATAPGVVSEFLVTEGEQVLEGQQIVTVRDNALDSRRAQQKTRIAVLEKELEAARGKVALELQWRLHELDKEIMQHRQAIVTAREEPATPLIAPPSPTIIETGVPARTASLKRKPQPIFFNPKGTNTAPRGTPIIRATQSNEVEQPATQSEDDPFATEFEPMDSGLQTATRPPMLLQVSAIQTEARTVALSSGERIKLAEERITELQTVKNSLRETVELAVGLPAAQQSVESAKTRLDAMSKTLPAVSVTTNGFGIVSKYLCQPGEEVTAGQPVLELIDSRKQHVAALIPSRHVDTIEPGMKVSLYFPGNQHRRGRINSLPVRATERGESGESMLEIRIEPMGGLWPTVPIGSQVQVAID